MKNLFKLCALCMLVLFTACNQEKTLDVKVMSFNIRLDVASDSLNNWQYRKDVAAQVIKDQNADIVGMQEVMINQLNDFKERLPEYTSVGVGRADGAEGGEFSNLFFKTARFDALDSGTFWLSETPEAPGVKGWDAAYERVATWAILQDKQSKKQLFAINTHLDHVGKVARVEGVKLLTKKAADLGKGLPVIMTGDFNATPHSDVIHHIIDQTNPYYLVHTRNVAKEKLGYEWTFHDFGRIDINKREFIDYIFVNQNTIVDRYEVVEMKIDNIFLSDHCPIVATVRIK